MKIGIHKKINTVIKRTLSLGHLIFGSISSLFNKMADSCRKRVRHNSADVEDMSEVSLREDQESFVTSEELSEEDTSYCEDFSATTSTVETASSSSSTKRKDRMVIKNGDIFQEALQSIKRDAKGTQ